MSDPRRAHASAVAWLPIALLLAAGLALRLRAYCAGRSLWLDELLLWTTLGDADPLRFLAPLGEGQFAAPGFVLLAQLVRSVLGDSEWALRLLPLLCGIAALPLMHRLACRLAGRGAALFALAALAFSPAAVYYSADFKPYTIDLCAAILVLLTATRELGPQAQRSRLAALGFVVVFVSLPGVFVLAGVGTIWIVTVRREPRLAVRRAAFACGWALLFVVQYAYLLQQEADPQIESYWRAHATFPDGDSLGAAFAFVPSALVRALADPGGFGDVWGRVTLTTLAAAALWLLGAVRLVRSGAGRRAVALLVLPVGATLIAAMLRQYPFGGRVLLFLAPALVLPVAVSVQWLVRRAQRAIAVRGGAAWAASSVRLLPCLALLLEPAYGAARRFHAPYLREEARPVLEALREELRHGDVLYLTWYGRYAFNYYAPRVGIDPAHVRVVASEYLPDHAIARRALDFEVHAGRSDRVWLFVTHFYPETDSRAALLAALSARGGRVLQSIEAKAAAAHRIDASQIEPPGP